MDFDGKEKNKKWSKTVVMNYLDIPFVSESGTLSVVIKKAKPVFTNFAFPKKNESNYFFGGAP